MPDFYLTAKQGDFNQVPELQVCIAEALVVDLNLRAVVVVELVTGERVIVSR